MNKINKDQIDPVVEPESEKIHRMSRAIISAVPVLGGPLLEGLNALIEPPMARRRTEWMTQVTEAINDLVESKGITIESLQENEKFFTVLVTASNIAIKNHLKEKLDALKNAVINSALPGAPDDVLQQIFLNLIDNCTTWHIAILKLYHGPVQWAQENGHIFPDWSMGGIPSVIESAYPELNGQREVYNIVWQELNRYGLINTDNIAITMTVSGMLSKRTTSIGDMFLEFISSPKVP
ncbi:MAG: hypothetical protein EPN93_14930 [Spirochaetes bacterium]|nr:MAG: hypothetical protein EPN93_14930 [Spirochaetota bacterium]